MKGLAGRLAILLALGLAAASGARASEIACPPNYQASTVRCVGASSWFCARTHERNAPGERLICEYAMLNVTYENIYVEQQRRLRAGTLQMSDLMAWRRRRNACETVKCVDAVFADWRRMSEKRPPPGHAPLPLPSPSPRSIAQPDSRPVATIPAATTPASVVPPPLMADTSPLPQPDPPAVPVKPGPVLLSASPSPARSTAHSSAPWAFAWLALLAVVLCMLVWALMYGTGHETGPASVRSLADRLHHLPHMALLLATLALLNGVLLVLVLES